MCRGKIYERESETFNQKTKYNEFKNINYEQC